jgi:hypothetical protein
MNDHFLLKVDRVLLFIALLVASANVAAELGQGPLRSSHPVLATSTLKQLAPKPAGAENLYTVRETLLETGTSVREYLSSSGVVFAVAWQGPVIPDLNVLLGAHAAAFKQETDRVRGLGQRGAPVDIAIDGLVVRSQGHMRDFFGHAYVLGLVPTGVVIKDILE